MQKKREFIEEMKAKAKDLGNTSLFYEAVRDFRDFNRPPEWSVRSLFPRQTDEQVADGVNDFFNVISAEFNPISDRGSLEHDEDWSLEEFEVADVLRACKKPKSRVEGGIFSDLIAPNSYILALPLTDLYNCSL